MKNKRIVLLFESINVTIPRKKGKIKIEIEITIHMKFMYTISKQYMLRTFFFMFFLYFNYYKMFAFII